MFLKNKKIINSTTSNNLPIIFFIFMFLLNLYPLIAFKYSVLVDYPNHLASFFIQANIDNDNWLKYNYFVEWHIKPNIIFEWLGGALAKHLDIFIAGKIIIIVGITLICTGVLLIRKSINGCIDNWMIIILAFIYNFLLFFGFINYYASSGVALIAMYLWIKFREINSLNCLLLFSAISTFLFFCHLFALAVYGIFVLGYEMGIYRYDRDKFAISNVVKSLFQFILPSILFFIWHSSLTNYDYGSLYKYEDISWKITTLLSPIVFDFNKNNLYLTLFILISILFFRILYRSGISIYSELKMPLIFLFCIYIITPIGIGGSWAVDLRFPYILILLLVASIRFDESQASARNFRTSIVGIGIIAICFKVYFISSAWAIFGQQYQELEDALDHVTRGSKVITVQEASKNVQGYDTFLYHHIAALSIIKRSAFWPNLFTVNLTPIYPTVNTVHIHSSLSKQLSLSDLINNKFKNGYKYDKGAVVYWENWTQDFDYLISMRFENMSVIDIKNLKLIVRGSFFDIYQIVH
ncbi:MAG: hypothetical protein PHO08_01925 [Methylococcales bacterium]|nr:hypothetical protein [Methylococcales bacterium]MDD5631216.1 hypothetical protein [Methylococcales bacterium]